MSSAAVRSTASAGVAGILLALAGVIFLMGVITAEATYPDVYTTHDNEISDLGATRPPDSIIRQPSARIFNTTMLATGALILASAWSVRAAFGSRRTTISMALLGIGVLGVGIFPGNRAPMHGLFAMLAFVAGGLACILSARVQEGMFRWLSRGLGVVALGSLVVALFSDSTPIWDELGDGGVERWIAYPVALWMVAFGAYLCGVGRTPGRVSRE